MQNIQLVKFLPKKRALKKRSEYLSSPFTEDFSGSRHTRFFRIFRRISVIHLY